MGSHFCLITVAQVVDLVEPRLCVIKIRLSSLAEPHLCDKKCHNGDCGPCNKNTLLKCECGAIEKKVPCEVAVTFNGTCFCFVMLWDGVVDKIVHNH